MHLQDAFRIGMAGDVPAGYSDEELLLASRHFNAVTPENCMKPEPIHPAGRPLAIRSRRRARRVGGAE